MFIREIISPVKVNLIRSSCQFLDAHQQLSMCEGKYHSDDLYINSFYEINEFKPTSCGLINFIYKS
jgi:hypothetical protein